MAKQPKRPDLTHCAVTYGTHPKAPWRVTYDGEKDGKRARLVKTFSNEEKAWTFAVERDQEISNHGARYGDIPNELRRAYDSYRDVSAELRELGAEVPSLESILNSAVTDLRSRLLQKSVADGVEEFLGYKKTRVKIRQFLNLTDQLKRFTDSFQGASFASITTAQIDAWLQGLRNCRPGQGAQPQPLSALSRNHYRAAAHAVFEYATDPTRAWCPRNPVAALEPEDVEDAEPEAYSPEDSRTIMLAALNHKPDLIPVLALGFFGGCRISEAVEIDLGKLRRDTAEFRVNADRKTGARAVPFLDSCKAWLFAQPRRKGKAWLGGNDARRNLHDQMQKLLKLAKVTPIKNGARHSYISYRCADTRDIPRVADEVGNSVGVISKCYRALVSAADAEVFFAIRPETAEEKIVAFSA